MIFKSLIISFILTLVLSGCGSTKSETTTEKISLAQVEKMLQEGDYSGVIDALLLVASSYEEYLSLAEAYMGMSGLTIDGVIEEISSQENSLMGFTQIANEATKNSDAPLAYLNQATQYYLLIVGERCEKAAQYHSITLTPLEEQVCLYKGLSQTMEVVTIMNYIIEDIENMTSAQGEQDNKLKASSCAMQYGFNGVSDGCSISEEGNVTFSKSQTTYEKILVSVNGYDYDYLLVDNESLNTREVILTDGYCLTDNFSSRVSNLNLVDGETSEYEVCPVNLSGEDETLMPVRQDIGDINQQVSINKSLVENLNQGTNSIIVGGSDNSELLENVERFKQEIFDARVNDDTSDVITAEDIINYLNTLNK